MVHYLIGIDVGSSDCKCIIMDTTGYIIADKTQAYSTHFPHTNWAQQNPEDWYQSACNTVKACLETSGINPAHVIGIAIDGPAHNVALMDEDGEILYPTIHWSDLRSVPQSDYLDTQYGSDIFKTTYCRVNPAWTLSQLMWLKENEPIVWSRLRRILVTKDYVRYRFTGNYQTDEYDAIGTQLYDVEQECWSSELCALLDFDPSWLPPVLSATAIGGGLTASAAQDTGLIEGIPIAVGSGDSVVEAAGIGALSAGQCLVKLGTAANVNLVTAKPLPSQGSITYRHVVDDYWFTITATNAGAYTMRWFRDTFCRYEVEQAALQNINVYELTDKLAESSVAGSHGLLFHPYIRGERSPYWDPQLRGNFVGIHARHTIHDFARAVLEGVSYSIRDCLDVVKSLGQPIEKLFVIGGGAKSVLWRQILCDVLGETLIKPSVEDAAFGSALLAGIAVGAFDNWEHAVRVCSQSESQIIPNTETRRLYDDYFDVYRAVTQDLQKHDHRLSQLALLQKED